MNAPVHRKIVEDALVFMNNGDSHELLALWRLRQLAGGENELLQKLSEDADRTDQYSDLQIYVPLWMGHYADWNGKWTTGLNHYVNAFLQPQNWDLANGYHYPWSSRSTLDEYFHHPIIDFLDVNIEQNPDYSPALGRLPDYWLGATRSWDNNWDARLPFSEYAPCSAVAATYYDHLVNHYDEPMYVNVYGDRPNLQEIEKLGPILHFMGDAIVPQHVRGAHGFLHEQWENAAQTLVGNGIVGLDATLVRNLLSAEPFTGWYWQGGPLNGLYAVDFTILGIADMTREKMQSATNTDLNTLFDYDDVQWMVFCINQVGQPNDCMKYLYNLGVAGCVHTLRRASEDLLVRNIGPAPQPVMIGTILSMDLVAAGMARRRERPVLSLTPEMFFRFAPTDPTLISNQIRNFEQLLTVNALDEVEALRVTEALGALQESMEREFMNHNEPAALAGLLDSNLERYVFRPPTMEECSNEQRFRQYLKWSEIHKYKIHLLDLTRLIAALNAHARREGPMPEIEQKRQGLETRRRQLIAGRAVPRPQAAPEERPALLTERRPLPPNLSRRSG